MSRNRTIAFALVFLVIGLAVGYSVSIAVPFQLPSATPSITLSENSVKAGAQYTATLNGFPANTEIYGWTVNQNPPQMFSVGTTNANGHLEATSSAPQTPGTYPLIACDKTQTHWATTILTVTQP